MLCCFDVLYLFALEMGGSQSQDKAREVTIERGVSEGDALPPVIVSIMSGPFRSLTFMYTRYNNIGH